MTLYVVSANYRDRTSEKRWLLRKASDSPRKAVAFKQIDAEEIAFCPSSDYESGFGCSVVGYCRNAVGSNKLTPIDTANTIPLTFKSWGAFHNPQGQNVPVCKTLRLSADGKMYATVPAEGEVVNPFTEERQTANA